MSKIQIQQVRKEISCGECMGLSRRALKSGDTGGKPSESVGVLAESKPCAKFRPDVFALSDDSLAAYRQLTNLTKGMSERDLRVVAAAIMTESKTRQLGLRAGQRVYVRYRSYVGRDYISNFMLCYLLDARDDVMHLTSKDGAVRFTFPTPVGAKLDGPSLYSAAEFRPMIQKMRAEGKYFDPKAETSKRLLPEEDVTYLLRKEKECGSNVIESGDAVRGKRKAKKGRNGTIELGDIVAQIERGSLLARHGDEFSDDVQVLGTQNYERRSKPRRTGSGEIELGSINYSNKD